MADGPHLNCGSHGRRRWHGDVVCDGCGRVYQTKDESLERFALPKCWCGMKLMPTPEKKALAIIFGCDDIEGPLDFSARSICHDCFVRWDRAS